ncbi:MAG: hypothetical protein O6924_12070, partial [Alphaproteobacteria bacterium]|nr:hypothetical protein [Alphaproteobacteria bacterium]
MPWAMMLLAIICTSLAYGFGAGIFVLVVTNKFFWGQLGPIPGFLFSSYAFVIGTFLAGLFQIRRARTLPKWGRVGFGLFLALVVIAFP